MTGIAERVSDLYTAAQAIAKRGILSSAFSILALFGMGADFASAEIVVGTLKKWHPVEIHFSGGPTFCETSSPSTDGKANPFMDRRLNVILTHFNAQSIPTHSMVVPGFFAGDGNGGSCGNTWVVRFTPDAAGSWSYRSTFRAGTDINVSLVPSEGSATDFDGEAGNFVVQPLDPDAPGFLGLGRLKYVGAHYLKHADGGYFIKGGADSPENLLGADAFDDTIDQSGGVNTSGLPNGLHRFPSHVADFGAGGLGSSSDPFWTSNLGGDSRGVIGLLNYIASRNVNSIYFLPMNLGGDGRETYPFVSPNGSAYSNTHYDVSKLHQWNKTLDHAQRLGIMWQCVFSETEFENETWFGSNPNDLTDQRKLFFREIIARFSYLNGIKWNLGEEADFSVAALEIFADYIKAQDPYGHMIAFHTNTLPTNGNYSGYTQVLGDSRFSAASLQHIPGQVGKHIEKWRADSAASGRKWVVDSDEQINGVSSSNQDMKRKQSLYDALFSGGSIEWYLGDFSLPEGGDLTIEDMRTRELLWDQTRFARRFVQDNLNFIAMVPDDIAVVGESQTYGGAEVFAEPGKTYAVYYGDASDTGFISLPSGIYKQRWYNPRLGRFTDGEKMVAGGGAPEVGAPPSEPSEDWVALFELEFFSDQLNFTPLTPGIAGTLNSASLSGATPGGPILMFYSTVGTGTFPLPGCAGVVYNLVNTKFGFTLTADALGEAQFSLFIGAGPEPGSNVFLQALDPLNCLVSPVITFTW